MIAARRLSLTLAGLAIISLAGCQSTRKPDPEITAPVVAGDFAPVAALSLLRNESGRYPNLFAPSSYALWITDSVALAKYQREQQSGAAMSESLQADAQLIAQNYYVIEINLDSAFPDGSIAYDVVGLRSVDAYLTLPDGSRLWPVQRVLGTSAREGQDGTLRRFGRTNIVVFPKIDVLSGTPTIPASATGLRLTLDGFNSIFTFEWAAAPSLSSAPIAPQDAGGLDWSSLYGKLRELSRLTQ